MEEFPATRIEVLLQICGVRRQTAQSRVIAVGRVVVNANVAPSWASTRAVSAPRFFPPPVMIAALLVSDIMARSLEPCKFKLAELERSIDGLLAIHELGAVVIYR